MKCNKIVGSFLAVTMITGLITGCGSKAEKTIADTATVQTETDETENGETTNTEPVQLVVWHDNDETMMNALGEALNQSLAAENITVSFEKKSDVTSQIKLYGTDSQNGPDMYLFAHDSLGNFAEMGILEPVGNLISADQETELLPMTINAASYKNEQYLMPVYYETLLFMYNKALWKGEIPITTDELYDYMVKNTDINAGTYALVNQHSGAYNVAPVINGFGGYIINDKAEPGLNQQATKDAIEYNKKFAELEADGDYNTVTTLFNEQKAAAIIGGPWLVSGIKDAGIDLGIKSLASMKLPNGNSLKPYSGVQCIGVLKYAAESKKEAVKKVLEELTKPEIGIMLAKDFNCAPANAKAYEDQAISSNEMIQAMKETAEIAEPMPNIPQMGVMWGPTESLLAAVNKSNEDIDKAADQYQEEALTAIKDMQ